MFQMKQHSGGSELMSRWQLEEAQVFWFKGEQGLALGRLRQMINSLEDKVTPRTALHHHEGATVSTF